ncbi:GMC oxidoreductase [Favolaschia claudopus]|uniref:GMC oxidoreductase n=1 Tax=Favolaschia claudopus TaxID=2862362 RepID=A0AAV9ZX24_9AGAR
MTDEGSLKMSLALLAPQTALSPTAQMSRLQKSLLLILSLAKSLCWGSILDKVTDLDQLDLEFDFIVVGGGTAGNVVANRLTENPDHSVLVLEAGGSNDGVVDVIVPFYSPRATPNTPQDWNYTTTPQVALNNRKIQYPRGFVLGGSSSVNYLGYTRGSKEDYDRWANVTGESKWSWDELVPYMYKASTFAVKPNDTGKYNPAVHGFDGITSVSLPGFPTSIDSRVFETTSELASEFPFNEDMNSGYHLGIGWEAQTVKNGSRSSSATSYLAPDFVKRPNLHVLLNARVTRVLQTEKSDFRTVEFVQDLDGKNFTLTATKEVILSAGSINSPAILLHSGIGNATSLTSLNIKPTHHLPSVGQNLTDHALLFFSFLVNSTDTWETAQRNATLAEEQFDEWNSSKTGPLIDPPTNQLGWFRVADDLISSIEGEPDAAAGRKTAHYEIIFGSGSFTPAPPTGNYVSIFPALVSPASRGSVTLPNNDPLSAPLINPNFLLAGLDQLVMREALKSCLRFAAAEPWKYFIISPMGGVNLTSTDAELDAFIRQNAGSVFHPVGTAAMSSKDASWGVVDPDLRVKGVRGLRVVDLSIAPFIPAAHTQAAAYIIGERASDFIKETWMAERDHSPNQSQFSAMLAVE